MKKLDCLTGILVLVLALTYAGKGFGAVQAKYIYVDRTTYLGPKHEDYGGEYFDDYEQFRYEIGTLHCRQGFIPISSYEQRTLVGTQDGRADKAALADEEKAVSGLFVIKLSKYVSDAGSLKCFPRSAETYSIGGIPYVAVADRPGAFAGPLPSASVGAVVAATTEGGAPAQVLFALNRVYSKPVVLQFKIGGTARNGGDYKPLKKKVTIPAGNISVTVTVVPKRDRKTEGTETVVISLKPNKKYGVSSQGSATVTISD